MNVTFAESLTKQQQNEAETIKLRAIPAITLANREIFNYSLTETKVHKLVECHSESFLCGHPVIKFHKRLEFNTIVFWIIYLYYSLLWNPFARRISANFFKKFYCLHRSLETRHNRVFVSLPLFVYRVPSLSDVWLLSRRLLPSCPFIGLISDCYFFVLFRKLASGVIFSAGFSRCRASGGLQFFLLLALWLSIVVLVSLAISKEYIWLMKWTQDKSRINYYLREIVWLFTCFYFEGKLQNERRNIILNKQLSKQSLLTR